MNTKRYLPFVLETEDGWFAVAIKDNLTGIMFINHSIESPNFEMIASIAIGIADEWNEVEKELQSKIGFSIPQTNFSTN